MATILPPSANKGSTLRAKNKIADPIKIRAARISPVHARMCPISAGNCLSSTRRVRRLFIAACHQCECDITNQANCRAANPRVTKDNPTTSTPSMEASVNGSLASIIGIGQFLFARCAGCHKKSDYKSECDKPHRPNRVFEPILLA